MTQLLQSYVTAQLFAPILSAALDNGGPVSPADLARARKAAEAAHERLDQALIGLGLLSEVQRVELLSQLFGVEVLRPEDAPGEPVLPDLLRAGYLFGASVLPVRAEGQTLMLAMVDPFDDLAASGVALKTGRQVRRLRVSKPEFADRFAALYGTVGAGGATPDAGPSEAMSSDIEQLRDAASDAPVIRFVQEAFAAAVAQGASEGRREVGQEPQR